MAEEDGGSDYKSVNKNDSIIVGDSDQGDELGMGMDLDLEQGKRQGKGNESDDEYLTTHSQTQSQSQSKDKDNQNKDKSTNKDTTDKTEEQQLISQSTEIDQTLDIKQQEVNLTDDWDN